MESSGADNWALYLQDISLSPAHRVLGLVTEDSIVGYAHLTRSHRGAHLQHIGMAKPYRGQGLGGTLLREVLASVNGSPAILL